MKQTTGIGVTKLVVSLEKCSLLAVHGTWRGAADVYVMIFDAKADPGDTATDFVACFKVYAESGFAWTAPDALKFERGCVILFSTTGHALTEVSGAGNVGEIMAYGEEFASTAVTSEVGDLTTGTDHQDLWDAGALDGNSPMILKRLEIIADGDAPAAYLCVVEGHTYDALAEDPPYTPAIMSFAITPGRTYEFHFGEGVSLCKTTTGDACVVMSLTSGVAELVEAGDATKWKIRATRIVRLN